MDDNDFKNMWQSSHKSELVNIEKNALLNDLTTKMGTLDKQIEKRNLREIVIGIPLILFFCFIAYTVPYTLTKIASLLIIPYYFFYMYKIKSVRRQKSSNLSQPPEQFLLSHKTYLQKEKRLLDSVLYWAILPFLPIIILFYAGFPMSMQAYIGYGSFTFVILAAVYWANKYAVNKTFIPLLKKLDGMISEFEEKEHPTG